MKDSHGMRMVNIMLSLTLNVFQKKQLNNYPLYTQILLQFLLDRKIRGKQPFLISGNTINGYECTSVVGDTVHVLNILL